MTSGLIGQLLVLAKMANLRVFHPVQIFLLLLSKLLSVATALTSEVPVFDKAVIETLPSQCRVTNTVSSEA